MSNPEWWQRAVSGTCSHGGHGWDGGTCSDAPPEDDLITEARAWLAELTFADEPDFAGMSEEMARRGIDCFYDGGWDAFVRDGE